MLRTGIGLSVVGLLVLTGCGSAPEPVVITSTDQALQTLRENGFSCDDPEVIAQGEGETFSTVDCGTYAIDVISDQQAWAKELGDDCSSLDSPEQREVLSEIALVRADTWLLRSRNYGEVQQWQPGAGPADFAAALGGSEETLAQVCESLGSWD
jgi:hypothetical protein